MSSTLIFPDGVRLAAQDELPGPAAERARAWARVQSAAIAPGFVLEASGDARFAGYAEINVDAPGIWPLFAELCAALPGPAAMLLFGAIDAEPAALGAAPVDALLRLLQPHRSQLTHDGRLQFGLLSGGEGRIDEVFVAPSKHFKVWLNDADRFDATMRRHGLRAADALAFLDEYPRTTLALPAFRDPEALARELEQAIAALSGAP